MRTARPNKEQERCRACYDYDKDCYKPRTNHFQNHEESYVGVK